MMHFNVLTLFPEFFDSFKEVSIIKNAIAKKKISIDAFNIRNQTTDKHKITDDAPFGGGSGMIMKAEPILKSIDMVKEKQPESRIILLTPKGIPFNQELAQKLSELKSITFVCPRYEGVDERVITKIDLEISLGDYIISGGEAAAMVMIDAISRLIKGVLGNSSSLDEETFNGSLLEYPQYTRPESLPTELIKNDSTTSSAIKSTTGIFHLLQKSEVPKVLLSGNHAEIKKWRRIQSIVQTYLKRPDLLKKAILSKEEKIFLKKYSSKKLSIHELKLLKGEIDE